MSDYSSYYLKAKVSPEKERVDKFQPETFTELENAAPIPDPCQDFDRDTPPRGPVPSPFEEFRTEKKPASSLMDHLPSLDGLFQPFDLTAENPVDRSFQDLYDQAAPAEEYRFEELDTRDPEVIRAADKAREDNLRLVREAEEKAARILETAETEGRVIVDEARGRADYILDEARTFEADLNREREEAQTAKAEAEAVIKAAGERTAGLEDERKTLEAEIKTRREELETEYRRLQKNLEDSREATLKEARAAGLAEGTAKGVKDGHDQAYNESLAALQKEAEGFIAVMGKIENLYQDLWQANGPLMIKLAVEGVEKILNQALENGEDLARGAFLASIDFLSQAHNVTFLARPQDIDQLEKLKAEQRERLGALVKVSFKPDPSLGPGDLIMESDVGRLDATVKHRAAQVLKALREGFTAAHGNMEEAYPPDQSDDSIDIEAAADTLSAAEPLDTKGDPTEDKAIDDEAETIGDTAESTETEPTTIPEST